jgi:hypothetical protein
MGTSMLDGHLRVDQVLDEMINMTLTLVVTVTDGSEGTRCAGFLA